MSAAFREDKRLHKVDLGIGVYKDESGHSRVLQAVKLAEQSLLLSEDSKAYVGLAGDEGFNEAMRVLLLGGALAADRVGVVQTPGAAGAVRVLCELIQSMNPRAAIWISDPTWVNHVPIALAAKLEVRQYRYLDRRTQALAFEDMMEDLAQAKKGDVVLLHGCCHNPSGANLGLEEWRSIASFCSLKGIIPFVDMAYQGFGDGLEQDAIGLRLLVQELPEVLIAASCSKNFGLYRERVGVAAVVGNTPSEVANARANILALARVNYSFPPNHGASVVREIWNDIDLRAAWMHELEAMRTRMIAIRLRFAEELLNALGDDQFSFFGQHSGMFSLSGLTEKQIFDLRNQHAIFIPPDGRLNVAGLSERTIPMVASAFKAVL